MLSGLGGKMENLKEKDAWGHQEWVHHQKPPQYRWLLTGTGNLELNALLAGGSTGQRISHPGSLAGLTLFRQLGWSLSPQHPLLLTLL